MTVKVKFAKPHVLVKPGAGKTTYAGTMKLDEELAKRWEKQGYLEIIENKIKIKPEKVTEPKPKRAYKKKVEFDG